MINRDSDVKLFLNLRAGESFARQKNRKISRILLLEEILLKKTFANSPKNIHFWEENLIKKEQDD